ncbi:MAG TPA: hypothetical protein VE133_11405 [Candidatus Sulfotelmatobacter sp.]|nr:hypothetical protein [Candidatus Sulfotelmatobacter sp.]
MKKLFTMVCTLVLGGALAFGQAASTGGQNPPAGGDQSQAGSTTKTKKSKSTKHKSGKKTKKSSNSSTGTATIPK